MEQEKFKLEQHNQNPQKKAGFGIWTLIISIVIAFGFGYGVGFVSSSYFRNININKELASNIQILQANETATKNQPPKTIPANQAKIAIQANNTNTTKSEINAIVNTIANQTNATKSTSAQENQKQQAKQAVSQAKSKTNEVKNSNNKEQHKEQANYNVQVASFPDRAKALNLVISLIQKGYNASSEQIIINNTPYTRVIITAHSLSQANKIAEKLKSEGITNLPIIYERK